MMKLQSHHTWWRTLLYSLSALVMIGLNTSLQAETPVLFDSGPSAINCNVITGGTFGDYTNVIYSTNCHIKQADSKLFVGIYVEKNGAIKFLISTPDQFSPAPATESTFLGSPVELTKVASGVSESTKCTKATYNSDNIKIAPATGYCTRVLLDTGENLYLHFYTDYSSKLAGGSLFTSSSKNISGNWIAEGYTCNGKSLSGQKVKIDEKGDVFAAIKLTGDDCMPAGYVTFNWDSNNDICHLIELINPGDSSSQSMNFNSCTLKRIDKDNFTIVLPDRDNHIFSFQKESTLPIAGFDITGIWNSGYDCNGQRTIQRLKINKNGDVFTAIKMDGDECMQTGYMQFYADLNAGPCQWIGDDTPFSLNAFYACDIHVDLSEGWFKISFPKNEEKKEMKFRKLASNSHNPTMVLENLNIQIPYAEYQTSANIKRTVRANLEFVPATGGNDFFWKLSDVDFLD